MVKAKDDKAKGSKAKGAEAGDPVRKEHWKPDPEDHDFPAAADYLTLVMTQAVAERLVLELRRAPTVYRLAKDLLRASQLALLADDNVHVKADLDKVRKGERLSPVLVVQGDGLHGVPLIVADGYHRICASHHLDENAPVPCRIVSGHSADQ